MRAVDTNIVVRYLVGDDKVQAAKARSLIGEHPVFVPRPVFLEVEWVLRSVYEMPRARIFASLQAFAGLPGVSVEDDVFVARALGWAEAGMDFADALHLAAASACDGFLTFDKRLLRAGTRLGGVPVTAL